MAMLKFVFTLFLMGWSLMSVFSQEFYMQKIADQADFFSTDNFNNVYVVSGCNVTKYSADGAKLSTFARFDYGEISSISTQNPQKIMVFYQDAGLILFLDKNLNPLTEPLNLFENQYNDISLATCFASHKICIYSSINQELIFLDFYMREISRSSIAFLNCDPMHICALNESMFCLQDSIQGVFVFDALGSFDRKLSIFSSIPLYLYGTELCYFSHNQWIRYNITTMQEFVFSLPIPASRVNGIQSFNKGFLLLDDKRELLFLSNSN